MGRAVRCLPFVGGLTWAVFALSRLPVALTGLSQGVPAVVWLWPSTLHMVLMGLATWLLASLAAGLQLKWLARRGLDPEKRPALAARAWWPSLALLLAPGLELVSTLYPKVLAPLALAQAGWPWLALAVAGAIWLQTRALAPSSSDHPRQRAWLPWAVFFISLLVFAGAGLRLYQVNSQVGRFMGGDEPQFLLNAHSLALDHDLDLFNNILLRDNRYFTGPAEVIGGHGKWTLDRAYRSKHRPGLPVLMAPFYAWGLLGGVDPRWACLVLLWLLSAWMCLEVFLLARRLTGREGPALAAAAACLCLPNLFYANALFAEAAGAALAVAALRRVLRGGSTGWGPALLAGIMVGYLAWLGERYIPLAAGLGLVFLWQRPWRHPKALAAFLLPCLASAGLLMYYYQLLYGYPLPSSAAAGTTGGAFLNPRGVFEGLSGLWVDGAEGLLPYGPLWLAGVAGLVWLVRKQPREGIWTALLALIPYLIAGLYYDWFGGLAPPARLMVAATPFLALGLAAGLAWGPPQLRGLTAWLAILSLAAALVALRTPYVLYGHQVLLDHAWSLPLVKALLPTYLLDYKSAGQNTFLAGLWLAGALLVVLAMQQGRARRAPGRSLAGIVLGVLLLAGLASLAEYKGPGLLSRVGPDHWLAAQRSLGRLGPTPRAWPKGPSPESLSLATPIAPELLTLGPSQGGQPTRQYALILPPGSFHLEAVLSEASGKSPAWLKVRGGPDIAELASLLLAPGAGVQGVRFQVSGPPGPVRLVLVGKAAQVQKGQDPLVALRLAWSPRLPGLK